MEHAEGTIHAMSRADLGKAYRCAGRTRTTCGGMAKVWVGGRPYCHRCGRRESKAIADIDARRADLDKQVRAIRDYYAKRA